MSEETLSADKISELKSHFASFDEEGNGLISSDNLIALLRCIGLNPTKSECEHYKKGCASDNNLVDFSMILTLVQNQGWDRSAEEQVIINAFAEFDTAKTGYIEESVLRKKLCSLGEDQLSKKELDKLMSLITIHSDGQTRKVNYKELSAVLCGKPK